MKDPITIGEKYDPAMKITDQAEADAYFEECVQHCMKHGESREEAETIERANLGYYAGYYDYETRLRVERLFTCAHPIFGPALKGKPTPEEAFEMGQDGETLRRGSGTCHRRSPQPLVGGSVETDDGCAEGKYK